MEQSTRYYLVVSPLAYTGKAQEFTYHHDAALEPGQVVAITLGQRKSLAVVRALSKKQPSFKTKPIVGVVEVPPLPPYLMRLAEWLGDYYASSLSAAWSTLLPTGLAKKRRLRKVREIAPGAGLPKDLLTKEQAAALRFIANDERTTQLVEGVTGSGKTRLYLELAAETLAAGRSVIVLVPEITLTPQLVGQFEEAFGDVVISTHSRLTEADRHSSWAAAMAAYGKRSPRVIVGPRSSLFLPAYEPGLIVIDECHETSYKQEQNPRYDALTTAAQLARITGARLVLGSATPALREVKLAQDGHIGHVRLTRRAGGQDAPVATIIDLRHKELLRTSKFISEPLVEALAETLEAGRQSLLFINRRGSATSQICSDCGEVSLCPNCVLPLTFHADLLRLICHHCNFRRAPVAVCPECGGSDLRYLGGGTKRIEAEMERLFPEARLARLDRDASDLAHIQAVYKGLQDGSIDILIGTQMVAKGLDLPRIDTIGVVSADTMLHLPDFTAAERTYGLLAQVSGRAGRGDQPGRVIIQTYTPDHPAITAAASAEPEVLVKAELAERRELGYPPYVNLLKLGYAAPTREAAQAAAGRLATTLSKRPGVTVVGPAPAFLETLGGAFHWQLAVKSDRRSSLVEIARSVPDSWTADLDPRDLL
jgi:primosomal protein N' (replication factor Y)